MSSLLLSIITSKVLLLRYVTEQESHVSMGMIALKKENIFASHLDIELMFQFHSGHFLFKHLNLGLGGGISYNSLQNKYSIGTEN